MIISNKEKYLFLNGIAFGVGGGIIGGLFINAIFYGLSNPMNEKSLLIISTSIVILVIFLWILYEKIEKLIEK